MKKALALILAVVMLCAISTTAFAETTTEETYAEKGMIFTNFVEKTDISELEVGKKYLLDSAVYNESDYLYQLPDEVAYVAYAGTDYATANWYSDDCYEIAKDYYNKLAESAEKNRQSRYDKLISDGMTESEALKDSRIESYNSRISDYKAKANSKEELDSYLSKVADKFKVRLDKKSDFYAEGYNQGYVAVIASGKEFDSCRFGTIGYLPKNSAIKDDKGNATTTTEDAWYYACDAGGVKYVGPYHLYEVTGYAVTTENIVIRLHEGIEPKEGLALTNDQVDVFVLADGKEIKISDYSLINTKVENGNIVVAVSGVKATAKVLEAKVETPTAVISPKTSDNSFTWLIAILSVSVLGVLAIGSAKKVFDK